MTQEEKSLLLKDLCSRLSYGVKVQVKYDAEEFGKTAEIDEITMIDKYGEEILLYHAGEYFTIEEIKPYLRPMSSMTEEERINFQSLAFVNDAIMIFDWLHSHHFDCRGLIQKNLAIEVTEENNPYAN